MILDIPYQSQFPVEEANKDARWCGLTCISMILSFYFREKAPSLETLVQNFGSKLETGGFTHRDLINFTRVYGMRGFRKSWWASPGDQAMIEKFKADGETEEDINDWSETNVDEGLHTIERMINQKHPVMVSVSGEFSPSKATHLVLITGYENGYLTIHDPYKKGPNYKIGVEGFKKYWLKQAIFLLPQETIV